MFRYWQRIKKVKQELSEKLATRLLIYKLREDGIDVKLRWKSGKLRLLVQDYNKKNKKHNAKLVRIYTYILRTFKNEVNKWK